jgi:multidrug efflux pump subunit AcrB|nr:efflux RND transporter permease subunit [Candidatus Krumholzibacteria bacterium]
MIRFAVDHPVATWMLFTALIVTGIYAVPRLNIEAMPETDLPELTIATSWNGASPSAIQRSITLPIEEAVAGCHNVEDIDSRSQHGQSTVTVKYKRGTNMDFARLELSEQLGAVRRTLPTQAQQPTIRPYVPEELRAEEFFTVSLISPLPINELRDRAETWIVPRFLSISGVADAELRGGARPLVKVLLDLEMMERYNLTADGISNRLRSLDDIIPAGAVRRSGQELTVSVRDQASIAQLERTVLRNLGGQNITLGQVADVTPTYEDISYFSRINGENVITLSITKRSGQNSITVSRRLREEMPRIEGEATFPVTFEIDQDEGEDLEDKLTELVVRSLVILGLLFVMLAIALKRVRLTGIVVFSILLAIVICLSMFYFFGVSVNFITISGLTVCFGMLLDNSILVLDAIHRRLSGRSGDDARESLVKGTREVAFPIMATTLTTVVAFLSFIFMTDRLSLFYVPLAVSVGIAMLASIFVAFCWIPVALRGPAEKDMRNTKAADDEFGITGWRLLRMWTVVILVLAIVVLAVIFFWQGETMARKALMWVGGATGILVSVGAFASFVDQLTRFHLRFWFYPVLLTIGLFVGTQYVFKEKIRTGGFWRPQPTEQIVCYLERPVGTDVKLSSETMKLFESEIAPVPEGVTMRSTSFDNRAYMVIEFEEELLESAYPELFRNKLIVLAEELGGMFIWINGFGDPYMKGGRGGGNSNSTIRITGYNSKELKEISDGVLARLDRNRRVRNARLTSGDQFSRSGTDETLVLLNRQALAEHRLSMMEVMGHIRRLLGVETPWHMILDGEDQQMMLSFADAEAIEYDQILGRTMTTSRGQKVQLGRLISIEQRPEISSINRHDQRYSQRINWEYIGTDSMRRKFLADMIAGIELPYGYTAEDMSGQQITEEEEEELQATLWLTIAFILMALAAMFESLFLPFLVVLALPMAMVGVGGVFWGTGSEFDSSAKIGLILMFGIVVNNAILLINRFRLQVREIIENEGIGEDQVPFKRRLGGFDLWRLPTLERQRILRKAIVDGIRIQMRSILLTSGTTIAGLLPLLYKHDTSQGKDIWENLALSSIGGLTSSTVLILSAIPALYWMFTRWGWGLRRLVVRMKSGRKPGGALPEVATDP